jgi:hypothetical protein
MKRTCHNPESLEALASGDKEGLRAIVLAHIVDCGRRGTTADEACQALGLGHNSIAPRIVLLEKQRLIVKLYYEGKRVRRKTRLGCWAGVLVAADFAPAHSPTTPVFREFGSIAPERYCD